MHVLAHCYRAVVGLDWGNVPNWITALTASVVGAYTIVNVRTARKAYVRSKWTDEVSAARLAWSIVTRSGVIEKGEPLPGIPCDSYSYWDSHVTTDDGDVTRAAQRSVYLAVELVNGSNEPIGSIETRVYDALGRVIVEHSNVVTLLRPGQSRTTVHLSPAPENYWWSVLYSSIRFVDSSGLAWRRTDASPPERDEGGTASAAYHEQQAEKLRRIRARDADFLASRRAKRREEARARRAAAESSETSGEP